MHDREPFFVWGDRGVFESRISVSVRLANSDERCSMFCGQGKPGSLVAAIHALRKCRAQQLGAPSRARVTFDDSRNFGNNGIVRQVIPGER